MKAKLIFKLPEEQVEFSTAVRGGRYLSALHEVRAAIFRPHRKHGYHNERLQSLFEQLDGERNGDATRLIEMLENIFNEILSENELTDEEI